MSTPHDIDDANGLMARHLRGDDSAFIELFSQMNHRLYLYCVKIVGSAEQAEDLTQELWEKVIRLRSNQEEPVLNTTAFLLRMARNLCFNHLKTRRRMAPISMMDEMRHPSSTDVELSEREQAVYEALQELPVDYREVLVLNVYCGYQFEEIAEMLDKTPESIWKRASRAREKLRRKVINTFERG